jgi:hypothetical protein
VQLDINGALATRAGTTVNVSGATSVTVGNYSYIKFLSTISNAAQAPITLSNGLEDGQHLILYNVSGTAFGISFTTGGNLSLTKTTLNIYGGNASEFIWDATNTVWVEIGRVITIPNKQVFTATGGTQIFTVPSGVYTLTVKIWGAGGGPAYNAYNGYYSSGGSGGFVSGTISVTPLQNLEIVVGNGGTNTGGPYYGTFGEGGGGYGGDVSTNVATGGGGGFSGIFTFAGVPYAMAGGGGGAGSYALSTGCTLANGSCYGGAGGASTGGSGESGCSSTGGGGGTQTASGAAGTSTGGAAYTGGLGGQYYGGTGANPNNVQYGGGGGGGGGYYGGGGGAGGDGSTRGPSGGGGGSSYTGGMTTNTSNLQGNTNATGGTPAAPNNTDTDYIPGSGIGGAVNTGTGIIGLGGNGEIVISWTN